MKQPIAQWVQKQFSAVPDVRRASSNMENAMIFQAHDADVVVTTWMGAQLYVYILDHAPKIRDLRSILWENGRSGVGALFVVDQSLLPATDSVVRMVDWQDVLTELHDGFIYCYHIEDRQIHLEQAHFTPSNADPDEFRVWYFKDFQIENVSVRRRDLQKAVKGTFFVGDIASIAYKRRMNYERVNQRYHYRTKYTQQVPPGVGTGASNSSSNARPSKQRDDILLKYYAMLGVERNATETEIKAAFRRMAIKVHPDVSALPRQEANRRIKELNEAYDYIKQYHGWS